LLVTNSDAGVKNLPRRSCTARERPSADRRA
jgi:hypothetical protein